LKSQNRRGGDEGTKFGKCNFSVSNGGGGGGGKRGPKTGNGVPQQKKWVKKAGSLDDIISERRKISSSRVAMNL